jgi:hypothetical protein
MKVTVQAFTFILKSLASFSTRSRMSMLPYSTLLRGFRRVFL